MVGRFLTVFEAAEELHVSDKTVRNLISGGRLGVTRVGAGSGKGSKILISRDELEAYIAAASTPAAG